MVGVPRSQGCVRCTSRRIKCDMTRPECNRCLSLRSTCPGYRRGLKFQDQTRSLIQKYGQPSMDEAVAPNLTLEAINTQTRESFEIWLKHYFPSYMNSFNFRVDVNWMQFIRTKWSIFPPALIWGIRALISLHMGAVQGNKETTLCARHMYSRGIRHLAFLLQTRAALSDETLAAAILLGGYEVLDGSDDRSWIIHARGISHMLRARGPSAHVRGIGRTLMLSWRPYMVADAFIHAVPCFLGDPEWTCISMSEEVARWEAQQQRGSLLGQTMDYAFNEVAKCPGYLTMTKDIVTSDTDVNPATLGALLNCMVISRQNLVLFHSQLQHNDPPASFIGAIPPIHARTLVQGSRDGIVSAMGLLDQLLKMLQSHISSRASACSHPTPLNKTEDPWRLVARSQALKLNMSQSSVPRNSEEPDPSVYDIGDQLDKFSLTMGMGSLSPDACGCPQFSAHTTIPS